MSKHPIAFWKLNRGPFCPDCWIVPAPPEALAVIDENFWSLVESPNAVVSHGEKGVKHGSNP